MNKWVVSFRTVLVVKPFLTRNWQVWLATLGEIMAMKFCFCLQTTLYEICDSVSICSYRNNIRELFRVWFLPRGLVGTIPVIPHIRASQKEASTPQFGECDHSCFRYWPSCDHSEQALQSVVILSLCIPRNIMRSFFSLIKNLKISIWVCVAIHHCPSLHLEKLSRIFH